MCGRTEHPRRPFLILLFGALFAAGCGGPTKPSTFGPVLVCPSPLTVQSIDGNASPVIYEPPQVVAGEPPLRTTCAPASGSIFTLGASTVTCSTTDAALRQSSCSFTVTVTAPPKLAATRFMAFGNSITEGKNAAGVILANNYPAVLRSLLAARYTAQALEIAVVNRGVGGEQTAGGLARLPGELNAVRPDALLLEEGVNDLSGGDASKIAPMITALRGMVREGKARGIPVFLGTLLPERAGGPKAGAQPLITAANDQIRLLAQSEQATLVDLYAGFGGSADPYIDVDGLHPNELGYEKMAQVFFDAIRATLEGQVIAPVFVRNLPVPNMPGGWLR